MQSIPQAYQSTVLSAAVQFQSRTGKFPNHQALNRFMMLFRMSIDALNSMQSFATDPYTLSRIRKVAQTDGSDISYSEIYYKTVFPHLGPELFADQLKPYERAFSSVVNEVLKRHWDFSSQLLEVGSGGCPISEVVRGLSTASKKLIALSDVRSRVVTYLHQKYPDYLSKQRDLLNLSHEETANSLGGVVMTSVLDTLDIDQMKKGMIEIFKCLQPGGVLIHFAPRSSFPSASIYSYSSSDEVVFPIVHDKKTWSGFTVVRKTELLDKMKALDPILDKALIDLLERYIKMPPADREEWLTTSADTHSVYLLACMQEAFSQLNCSGVKTINFDEAFKKRLEDCALSVEGEVVFHGHISKSYIGERKRDVHEEKDYHCFSLINGAASRDYLGVLAPGMIQEVLDCHVFVIRKPYV